PSHVTRVSPPSRTALSRLNLELAWSSQAPVAGTEVLILTSLAGEGLTGGPGVVIDAPAGDASFSGDASLKPIDEFYKGLDLVFTSGENQGKGGRPVATYNGKSRTFKFADKFPVAPKDGDTFELREGKLLVDRGKVHAAPAAGADFLAGGALVFEDDYYAGA